jgi:hypothetical protein
MAYCIVNLQPSTMACMACCSQPSMIFRHFVTCQGKVKERVKLVPIAWRKHALCGCQTQRNLCMWGMDASFPRNTHTGRCTVNSMGKRRHRQHLSMYLELRSTSRWKASELSRSYLLERRLLASGNEMVKKKN